MAGDWDADDPAAVLVPFARRLTVLVPRVDAATAPVLRAAPASPRAQHAGRRAAQHRASLRPLQRSLRALPRRVDDVLVGVVRTRRHAGAGADAQDRPPARRHRGRSRARRCWRSAPAGVRWRSGPLSAARRSPRSRCPPSRPPSPGVARGGRRRGTRRHPHLRLPRDRRRVRRGRERRDDRGGRRAVLAGLLLVARARARARWTGRDPGDPARTRPHARHARPVHLDPQVHLPGWRAAVARGDRPTSSPRHTGLRVVETTAFGQHYATTLREWRTRFDAHACEVDALGFDERFHRMWDFYLAYCEAGFATGYLDVAQLVLSRP